MSHTTWHAKPVQCMLVLTIQLRWRVGAQWNQGAGHISVVVVGEADYPGQWFMERRLVSIRREDADDVYLRG